MSKKKTWVEERNAELLRLGHKEDLSPQEISEIFGLGRGNIEQIKSRIREAERAEEVRQKRDAQIRKLRYEEGLTLRKIGNMFGLSHERIRGIAPRIKEVERIKETKDVLLIQECIQRGFNITQANKLLGISRKRIQKLVPKYKFQARIQNFWSHIQRGKSDDCWPWLGCRGAQGYGHFGFKALTRDLNRGAHRIAWILHNWQPIIDGMQIQHTCDNAICCNPKHLYMGTQLDNMRDRDGRGRGNRSRLFDNQEVIDMRKRYSNGESIASIHRSLDPKIYYTNVFNAIHSHTYKNVVEV